VNTTARMQEVEPRREQLPRAARVAKKRKRDLKVLSPEKSIFGV